MRVNNSKKIIIKLTKDGKRYSLYNDGCIEDSAGRILDKDIDKELIERIMSKFKNGFSDDL